MSDIPIEYISDVKNKEDVDIAINKSPQINQIVNSYLSIYSIINVSDAMSQLIDVGDLLKVSRAASRGYPCSKLIYKVLNNYQSMVYDCDQVAESFFGSCKSSLSYYKFAISFIEQNKYDQALKIIGKASEIAQIMSTKAEDLEKYSIELVDLSINALVESTSDQLSEIERFRENEKKKSQLQIDCESLKSEIESLNVQIEELKELAINSEQEENEDKEFNDIINVIKSITNTFSISSKTSTTAPTTTTTIPTTSKATKIIVENMIKKEQGLDLNDDPNDPTTRIIKKQKRLKKEKKEKKDELEKKEIDYNELDEKEKIGSITDQERANKEKLKSEIKTLKDDIKQLEEDISKVSSEVTHEMERCIEQSQKKSIEYNKLKNQYQELRKNTNIQIACYIHDIKKLVESNYNIEIGIKCLQIIISSLGKVKTTFENTRIFWNSVKSHCDSLSDITKLKSLLRIVKPEKPHLVIKFENEIKRSGLSWLALAHVNLQALNSIFHAKYGVDEIMCNFPDKEGGRKIVKRCIDSIEMKLEKENKEISF